jgi:hypothetical protein
MKKLLISSLVCAATLSMNASASLKSANNLKFVGDTQSADLCEAAATNNLDMFKNSVEEHAYSLSASNRGMLRLLANENYFQCSGQSIAEFAKTRGSKDVVSYLTGESKVANAETGSLSKYKFVGDRGFKNFCIAAVTNNVEIFKRAVISQIGNIGISEQEVLDKVLEAENVTCAGQGLVEFFQQRQATSVMEYIADKTVL